MRSKFLRVCAILLCLITLLSVVACGKTGGDGDGSSGAGIYSATFDGVKIELGASAPAVLKKLGEPKSKNEIGDCGGLGAQVRYDFSSFILYVLESDEGDVIDQITFKDDIVETSDGISIGSGESDVREEYGEPSESKKGSLIYRDGNKQMTVKIENGKVASIDIMCVTD